MYSQRIPSEVLVSYVNRESGTHHSCLRHRRRITKSITDDRFRALFFACNTIFLPFIVISNFCVSNPYKISRCRTSSANRHQRLPPSDAAANSAYALRGHSPGYKYRIILPFVSSLTYWQSRVPLSKGVAIGVGTIFATSQYGCIRI